ncbi:MAG: hypothetical protein PVF45_09940 [Anaerolineae bacterium]|jgi:hypothetical protein
MGEWANYEEWMAQVPQPITTEEMWKFYGYRKALFFYDVRWQDCEKLAWFRLD